MNEQSAQIATPKVTRAIMRRSLKLLAMEYKPSELADELSISTRTIYNTYLPAGLPFRKDGTGHVWIVGTSARAWLEGMTQKSKTEKVTHLNPNEGFCVKCGRVILKAPKRRRMGRAGLLSGICPSCGCEVRRFIKLSEVTK